MTKVFKLEELPGPIALLTFDTPEKKVNTLGRTVLEELGQIVAQLEKRTDLHGLLLRSGKPGQFIAGADLNELGALVSLTAEQLRGALSGGHALFDRVSSLPFPTVSLIDGPCMGGGTELSLALDERLASNNPKTRIGLPEVTIGLIPGWGGTQRLPRLVGLPHAIDMICTGEPVTPQKAAAIGLVFDAVPAEKLVEEGCRVAEYLYSSGEWKKSREKRRQPLGLSQDQMLFTIACAEGQIKAKTKGQPSASLVALKALQKGVNLPLEEGLAVERKTAEEVVGSEVSGNLIGIFFMNTALSRDRGVADDKVQPRAVRRAGVLGSGLMGAGIATAHARSGIPCGMVDVSEDRLADGLARAQKVVMSRIEIGRATPADMVQLLSNLNTSTSHSLFSDCDVVVEAITENEELKTQAYRQLAGVMRDDAILATNTSTISIGRMAKAAKHPDKFVGMHFFFPVDRMQLVEVIRGDQTSDETVVTIVELARKLRKTAIVCNDCPGFLVNRILLPYMNEAVLLLLEGADMDQIDRVVTRFGFPMGPIALHDLVGLDTAFYAGKVMLAGFRDRTVETPLLGDLVKAGRLGKKSGAGFRKFVGKKGTPAADPEFTPILERNRISSRKVSDEEVEDRLLLAMLLEAVRVLEEKIVREPMHVDMGLILGIGFPPFRGGLLKWCDNVGAAKILERVKKYSHLGKRFEPTEQFVAMAQSGAKFYPPLNEGKK
jgi:3-hydroxyacyl-CoA dehydrogenase/enoyl-CoA hydratase/3-hydroxybutyryl-CoA epimerase/3-hydroxyacyl-CoA dehydrogenase/enoyl-CoA hydratase/3-hydroxybutyryl-CoA epimerase/enoyl-CoA isomerase